MRVWRTFGKRNCEPLTDERKLYCAFRDPESHDQFVAQRAEDGTWNEVTASEIVIMLEAAALVINDLHKKGS